jgi:hypothetical protein
MLQSAEVGTAPKGYHQIASGTGGIENVKTLYSKGQYHVHTTNPEYGYSVTHGPSGMRIGHFSSKAKASAAARHFHKEAPDAGASAKLGSHPSKAEIDVLRSAFKTLPAATTR